MIQTFIRSFLAPRTTSQDSQRKEFILNILLFGSMVIFALGTVVNTLNSVVESSINHDSASSSVLLLGSIFLFLSLLFILSRKGHFKISAYIVVGIFFFFALLMGYQFGIDVSVSLLVYALVIVMAGILINTRFAFITTIASVVALFVLSELQTRGILLVDDSWRTEPWYHIDTVMTGILFLL